MSLEPVRSLSNTAAAAQPARRGSASVMRKFGVTLSAGMLALLCSEPLMAAECKQGSAVYTDRDGAYELRFMPLKSEAAASNQFKIKVLKTSMVLDGYVMPSEDPDRSIGMVMFNCPGGDVTGDDLNACTIWQGIVYGIDAKGEMNNLEPEAGAAADKIVLPGIGPAIRASSIWGEGKASVAPWDVLNFKECAS